MDKEYLKKANLQGHLIVENEKQENCKHDSWQKVTAIDEIYWRCLDCLITNSEPLGSK